MTMNIVMMNVMDMIMNIVMMMSMMMVIVIIFDSDCQYEYVSDMRYCVHVLLLI